MIADQWVDGKYNRIQSENHKRKRVESRRKTFELEPERFCGIHSGGCKKRSLEERINHSCVMRGINIEDWAGFVGSSSQYCNKFNESLKTKIRNQYNNCDYISGIHKNICSPNRNLDVHRVDYDKEQGCNDIKWKLVPLCHVNHARTNINRPFWNRLFIYSLEIDKWYYNDNKY